jgi:hypothetical protein
MVNSRCIAQPMALLKQANINNKVAAQAPNDKTQIDVIDVIDTEDTKDTKDTEDTEDTEDTKNVTFVFNNRAFLIPVDEEGQIKWLDKLIAGLIYHLKRTQNPLVRNLLYNEAYP